MSQGHFSTIKRFKRWSAGFLYISGGLTLPALFLWLFGAPGIDGRYAEGWKLGFGVLIYYLMGCIVLGVANLITAIASRKFRILDHVNTVIIGLYWAFFGYCAVELLKAFPIMSSGYQ